MSIRGEDRLTDLFGQLGIMPPSAEHPAVYTVEEAAAHPHGLDGEETKNFFLKDAKGGALHLVTVRAGIRVDLKALAPLIGAKRLSFASPELLGEVLGVLPGSVSPLCLVNDADHRVAFAIDRALTEAPRLTCHPLRNTATVSLSWGELSRLLAEIGVAPSIVDLPG